MPMSPKEMLTLLKENGFEIRMALIPEWLNEAAIRENINFSQILQEALMVKLGILQTRF